MGSRFIDFPTPAADQSYVSIKVSVGDLEQYARDKVANGEYNSVGEAIQEGLRLLKRRDDEWSAKARPQIESGMAQLRAGKTISGDSVFAEVRRRLHTAPCRRA